MLGKSREVGIMPEKSREGVCLYRPTIDELAFRQKLLSDEKTMTYNHAYGGIIPFPKETWLNWYNRWISAPDQRYYRYLRLGDTGEFVGEVAWHYDVEQKIYLCDVLVLADYRGKGYGTTGLALLCEVARESHITELYDDIARDNPSVALFLKNGFSVAFETDEIVMVKKAL